MLSVFTDWVRNSLRRGRLRRLAAPAPALEGLEGRELLDAALPLRLDFGSTTSPVAPGYTRAPLTTFSTTSGFGWENLRRIAWRDRGTADPLTRDFHIGYDNTFRVQVPNGRYDVAVGLGDPLGRVDRANLWAEGQQVVTGLSTATGQTVQRAFPVEVKDGFLNLRFTSDNSAVPFAVNGLTVTAAATPPPPPPAPTANAGADLTSKEGQSVQFTGTATGSGTLTYAWDFGDGTTGKDTLTPYHLYADNGTYTATLSVTDSLGRVSRDSAVVTVANVAPTLAPSGPYLGLSGAPVAFSATVTDPGSRDVAAGFTYLWTFGDGTTSTEPAPSRTYAAAGTYSVGLTVRDKDGGSATVATSVWVEDPLPVIQTGHDAIPDYGARPTIVSVGSGNWSDARTWSAGRVPRDGDVVAVAASTVVTYDLLSDARLKTVVVRPLGKLTFRTDVSTRMVVSQLLVREGGALEVGTPDRPVAPTASATIRITDQPIHTLVDPRQFGNGLIGLGKVTLSGAAKAPTFVRLAAEAKAGDTTVTLTEPAGGWRAGDRLAFPDTRQLRWDERDDRFAPQWEELTLRAVSADGKTLTLDRPLAFNHLGARDGAGALRFLPHVTNLTRNLTVESANPAGTRGHVFLADGADVDVRYVNFHQLGRTTIDPLDSTTADSTGRVTRVGTNQIGRYPLHLHHLHGPAAPQASGYQYTVVGNSIENGSAANKFKWGVAVHDSHYGLIRDNVVYNVAGAGILTEDGSEAHNLIAHNYVLRVTGTSMRADRRGFEDTGHEGAGFWFRGTLNRVVDNVSANTFQGYGFTYFMAQVGQNGVVKVPAAPGSHERRDVDMGATPMLEFARNETYSSAGGLSVWHLGAGFWYTKPIGQSVVKDMRVWHHVGAGTFAYAVNNVLFDGYVALGNGQWVSNDFSGGLFFSDYLAKDVVIRNADIQGVRDGIIAPYKVGDMSDPYSTGTQRFLVENSRIRALEQGLFVGTQFGTTGGGANLTPREILVRNVKFELPFASSVAIRLIYVTNRPNLNYTVKDTVKVTDYNGVAGDSFQVYYREQRPDFILPKTGYDKDWNYNIGSPEEGLTNAQNWAKYGIALGGAVLPADAATRAGIDGLVKKL